MSTLHIYLKDTSEHMRIETSKTSALRILNRYSVFLNQGEQATFRFPVDGADAGMIALDFANVTSIQVTEDDA